MPSYRWPLNHNCSSSVFRYRKSLHFRSISHKQTPIHVLDTFSHYLPLSSLSESTNKALQPDHQQSNLISPQDQDVRLHLRKQYLLWKSPIVCQINRATTSNYFPQYALEYECTEAEFPQEIFFLSLSIHLPPWLILLEAQSKSDSQKLFVTQRVQPHNRHGSESRKPPLILCFSPSKALCI